MTTFYGWHEIRMSMGAIDKAIERIKSIKGVIDAYVMDDKFADRILEEERSVVSMTKMDVLNNAYEDVMKRMHRIAVIFDNDTFDYPRDTPSIVMVNSKGKILGKSLVPSEIEEYKKNEDYVWVSSNFVIFDLENEDGGEMFMIPAAAFTPLNDVSGCSDAIFASPSTTSDMMIKEKAGSNLRMKTSTIVIGVNTARNDE